MRETAELYALPPEEFTPARNARAKELRREASELADAISKLPKPTAAAAAVNRLARDEPSEVRALVQAGRALRSAQEAAVSGKGAGAVADAAREHRAALDRVRREARRLGLSDAVLERVGATLRAASIDPELQPLLERGLLAREVEAAGFGLDPGLVVVASPADNTPGKAAPAAHANAARAALKEARAAAAEAKRRAADAARERKRIANDLAAAELAAERAQAELHDAEAAVERAQAAVDEARRAR